MSKTQQKPAALRVYKCWIYSPEYAQDIVARSAASARYLYFLHLDGNERYKEVFRDIRSKSLGRFYAGVSMSSAAAEKLESVKKSRNIPFAEIGGQIEVDGKMGKIVGGNDGGNLDVLFDGETYPANCHPFWRTTYFDRSGQVLRSYAGN